MPDILNDAPAVFAPGLPDIVGAPSDVQHNELRAALRTLNELHHGDRAAPGLTVRSVVEDGAIGDGVTDNLAAFQATVAAVEAAGGGVAFVPPTWPNSFRWVGTLTVPLNVVLAGVGPRSILTPRPAVDQPAINFAAGSHRGGVERLQVRGNVNNIAGRGIDLSGAHFLRLRDLQVWYYQVGVILSDGVTSFAAYNHLTDFEINACPIGLRAWLGCNQCSVREGRIWYCRDLGDGTGIAIDIRGADALNIGHIAVEDFDLGVRLSGLTKVSLNDIYYEADTPDSGLPPGIWMDMQPAAGSQVRMDTSHVAATQTRGVTGSLEDAITSDEGVTHMFFGAKRHHASAAERNLLENGDFHRADGVTIPGWGQQLAPILAQNVVDFVTAGRSYDVTQAADPNDGIYTTFTVPETTDYITAMVRYKNVSSNAPLFRLSSGANAGLFADSRGPNPDQWRIAAFTVEVDPADNGLVGLTLTADQDGAGGSIRIDEAWAVAGRTAAPPRAHAHRIEMLPEPLVIAQRMNLVATQTFAAIDLTALPGLPGLGGAPRGIVGAVLWLRGEVSGASAGTVLSHAISPFIDSVPAAEHWPLNITAEGIPHDRQVILRRTSFTDGITFTGLATPSTDYSIAVVGWILPS
ncbi:MAG: hypothetical protein AAGF11_40820 [Myxococcota bacterium]